jgi:hypothetical protein
MDDGGRTIVPVDGVEAILDVCVGGELGGVEWERVCIWVCMLEKVTDEVFLDFTEEGGSAVCEGRRLAAKVVSRVECICRGQSVGVQWAGRQA